MLRAILLSFAATAMLAACASPQEQQRSRLARMAERTLDRMELDAPRADPGLVAATDFAFARSARDTDLLSAFREYAATGAIRHAGKGAMELEASLVGHPPVPVAERWAPNAVWSSCNGRMAVSFGKFEQPSGIIGTYVTVWQRQADRSIPYKWLYRLAAKDAVQPAPRADEADAGPDVIVVQEMSAITALAADCPRQGPDAGLDSASATAAPPLPAASQGSAAQSLISDDKTLFVVWEHGADGTRTFKASWLRGGVWEEVVNMTVTDAGVAAP